MPFPTDDDDRYRATARPRWKKRLEELMDPGYLKRALDNPSGSRRE